MLLLRTTRTLESIRLETFEIMSDNTAAEWYRERAQIMKILILMIIVIVIVIVIMT